MADANKNCNLSKMATLDADNNETGNGGSTSSGERPQKLLFPKEKLLDGHRVLDMSSEIAQNVNSGLSVDKTTDALNQDEAEEQNTKMVAFVAEDFQEKLRLSGSATCSTASGESATSPNNLATDLQFLNDMEKNARQIALQLDRILVEFSGSVHGMTDLTIGCITTYTSSVKKTCDSVDGTIKSMYQMLAKSEELLHLLKNLPALAKQIREIKRLLDLFESHMQKSHG